MAPNVKESATFEAIIHNARIRRQKQALTDEFFGKGRKSSGSGSNTSSRKPSPVAGSLASRVEKRVVSGGIKKQQAKPLGIRRTRESRLLSGYLPTAPAKPSNAPEDSSSLSIKGRAAGPCVVVGSNFAAGTTAEDIEAAFSPTGGDILRCRITKTFPSVTAQLVFADRQGAANVVASFNAQKADGRVIQVRLDTGIDPSVVLAESSAPAPRSTQSAFDTSRELADKERRENRRPADVQDGRYGFEDPAERAPRQPASFTHDPVARNNKSQFWKDNRRRNPQNNPENKADLYSDTMMIDQKSTNRQAGNRKR